VRISESKRRAVYVLYFWICSGKFIEDGKREVDKLVLGKENKTEDKLNIFNWMKKRVIFKKEIKSFSRGDIHSV